MQIDPRKYTVLAEGRRIERPYLSPNGDSVVWTQDAGGQQDVFLASKGRVQQLTSTPENEGFALLSDSAGTVAFTRRSAETNLWQLHLRRDGQEAVVEASGHHVQNAALSADGSRLAWENYGHISHASSDQLLGVELFHGDHDARQLKPQLSGDGQTLLYQVSDLDSAESHLVIESPLGTVEVENNTDAPTALSFDGSKVVFPTTDDQGFHPLSVLDRASGQTTVISEEEGADQSHPSIASSGEVVYQMTRYDEKAQPIRSIVARDAQGASEVIPSDADWEPSLPQLSADGKTLLWLASLKSDPEQRQLRMARLPEAG